MPVLNSSVVPCSNFLSVSLTLLNSQLVPTSPVINHFIHPFISPYLLFAGWYVVTNWGRDPSLFDVRASFRVLNILGASVVTVVELTFLRRIWILSRRLLLTVPVLVLIMIQYTFAIICSALLLRIPSDTICQSRDVAYIVAGFMFADLSSSSSSLQCEYCSGSYHLRFRVQPRTLSRQQWRLGCLLALLLMY